MKRVWARLAIGAGAFLAGATAMAGIGGAQTVNPEIRRLLEIYGEVLDTVEHRYAVPVDTPALIEASISGMMRSLDPHSDYLSAADFQTMQAATVHGCCAGVGMTVSVEHGALHVSALSEDGPAARGGVRAGDSLMAIDGVGMVGAPLEEVLKRLRGDPGSALTLTLLRGPQGLIELHLVRASIVTPTLTARMEGDYGYLQLASLPEHAGRDTARALKDLRARNPGMKGLVLDLRDNPGGLLDECLSVSDVFLDGGEVFSVRGRDPRDVQRYNAHARDESGGLPLVVLVNATTAAGAELIAGALQERHRARVVGLRTFGSASIQTVIPLASGRDGAVKITTGRFYFPSGRFIQKAGVTPDVAVAATRAQAEAFAVARPSSEGSLRGALPGAEPTPTASAPVEAPPMSLDAATGDYQLRRALDLLRSTPAAP